LLCYFIAPDAVKLKSGLNIVSSILKFAAFAGVLGAEAVAFTSDLGTKRCYVETTTDAIVETVVFLLGFLICVAVSASLGLCLAPVSAFWGGKLHGVPFVK
jgi:hypothetical protein